MLIPKKVRCIDGQGSFITGNEYNVDHDGFICFTPLEVSGKKWNSKPKGGSVFEPIYTEEELLEYAEKMYPIGTKFKTASKANNETLTAHYSPAIDLNGDVEVGSGYLYYKSTNTWAEIVSEPKKIESFAIMCPRNYGINDIWEKYIIWLRNKGDNKPAGTVCGIYYGITKSGKVDFSNCIDCFDEIKPFEYIYELLNIPMIEKVGESLEAKYAVQLAKVKRLFPIGSLGEVMRWKGNGTIEYRMSKLISTIVDNNEKLPTKLLSSKKKKPLLKQVVAMPTIKNRIK